MKRTGIQRRTELKRTTPLSNRGGLTRNNGLRASATNGLKDETGEASGRGGQSTRNGANRPGARRSISPASDAQRRKVMGLPCLGCGREGSAWLAIDPAHVIVRSLGGCDSPACVIPLCRDGAGVGCHAAYDRGELDLLPYLEPAYRVEQAHAVMHVGIAGAFRKTTNDREAAK